MRWSVVAGIAALLGCHARDEPALGAKLVAPHSGTIRLIAVTDAGDAALTSDDLDELRLWPTLDGGQEPVVVRGPAAKQLALGRDGDGFLAAIVDVSGGAELIRLAADGRLKGRTKLDADPPCAQVVAIPGGVLVRRGDHTIERLDSHGTSRGRLVPPFGVQLLSVVARRNFALVAVVDEAPDGDGLETMTLRWIELDDDLRWGATLMLPRPISPDLAIAPNGRRLVGGQRAGGAVVFDVDAQPQVIEQPTGHPAGGAPVVGFLDDDHAVFGTTGSIVTWTANPTELKLPAQPAARSIGGTDAPFAIGDGVMLGGRGGGLELARDERTRFLGYRYLGTTSGWISPAGKLQTFALNGDVVWLDDRLRMQRSFTIGPEKESVASVIVDEHHVIAIANRPLGDVAVELVDATAPATSQRRLLIGQFKSVQALQYDPETRVLCITADGAVQRFALDLASSTATRLHDVPAGAKRAVPTNPAVAGGVSVVVIALRDAGTSIETFGDDARAMHSTSQLTTDYNILHVDRTATTYVAKERKLTAVRDGRAAWKAALAHDVEAGAPSPSGTLFAYQGGGLVTVIDTRGNERWSQAVWKPTSVTWSADERTVIVLTTGGVLALDAMTGARVATGCGWSFGLYETALPEQDFGVATVCQEAE